jgi:hypothetical protein
LTGVVVAVDHAGQTAVLIDTILGVGVEPFGIDATRESGVIATTWPSRMEVLRTAEGAAVPSNPRPSPMIVSWVTKS